MAKKTTKKNIDQRAFHGYYLDLIEKRSAETENKFLEVMSKGFLDFRLLVKPINEKITTAISQSVAPINIYNDNGDISVAVSLNDIHYSRHGLVIRYTITTDDRVVGSYEQKVFTKVMSFAELDYKPFSKELIDRVTRNMVFALEAEFNSVLFKNKLAPHNESRWEDE